MHTRKIFAKGATLPGKREYSQMVRAVSRKTNVAATTAKAFLIGGSICLIGEILRQMLLRVLGDETAAGTWVSVILVFCSALLTGLGLYEKIAKHGGAGTLVPITGFANAVSSAAVEAQTEGLILGVGAKIFTIAGPVLLYGTAAAAVYGVILWLAGQTGC